MSTRPQPTHFTADDFVVWAGEQPRGRFELVGGEVVAMAPERAAHTRTKLDATLALRAAIVEKGLGCEALIDGMVVRIDDRTVYEPDGLVRYGPRTPDDALEVADPVIVVEVVSPSSRGIDTGAKLAGYFRLPSLRHYLVLDTEARAVVHHRRDEAGVIVTSLVTTGPLRLDPPGLDLSAVDFFISL
jgi:Uma2 family endonuclease